MKKIKIALVLLLLVTVALLAACTGGGRSDGGAMDGEMSGPPEYVTITFDMNGGDAIAPITVPYGTCIDDLGVEPVRNGYNFDGWSTDGYSYFFQDITITANWVTKDYEVVYYINGEENYNHVNRTGYNIESDSWTLRDYEDVPIGYAFSGWYTDSDCTVPITSIEPEMTGDLAIYGKVEFYPYMFTPSDDDGYYFSMINFDIDTEAAAEDIAALKTVVVPDTYDGKPVIGIASAAFGSLWSGVEEIILPDSIVEISSYAFCNTSISSIDLPENLEIVGFEAFGNGCIRPIEYNGGYYIGDEDNPHCIFLSPVDKETTAIQLSNTTKIIASMAFTTTVNYWYPSGVPISEMIIPDSVISICYEAFLGCSDLERLYIGANVRYVGDYAFDACYNLVELSAPASLLSRISGDKVTSLTLTGGTEIGKNDLAGYTALESITLCDSITKIDENAFVKNENLSNVVLSDNITSIESLSFIDVIDMPKITYGGAYYISSKSNPHFILYRMEDSSATSIDIHPDTKVIWGGAFSVTNNILKPTFPEGLCIIGANAFTDSALSKWEGVEYDGVYYVGNTANPYLIAIDIAPGATVVDLTLHNTQLINGSMFRGNTGIKEVKLPNTIGSVGQRMFEDCTALETLIIADGVTSIGDYAFTGCTALKTLRIPSSVKRIGKGIVDFRILDNVNTGKLEPVNTGVFNYDGEGYYLGNEENPYFILYAIWSESMESRNSYSVKDTTVIIAPNVLRGDMMFEVVISNSVKIISDYAFGDQYEDTSSLVSVVMGNGVEYIGKYAFARCVNLKGTLDDDTDIYGSIILPDSLTYLGESAFYNCAKLTGVKIGTGLTEIQGWTFSGCDSIKEISIPNNVKSIGDWAFFCCKSLKTIRIGSGTEVIGKSAFFVYYNDDMTEFYKDGHVYCAASSKPEGWANTWINDDMNIHWGS